VSIFTIDQDKCQQDGLCAAECPLSLIEFKAGAYPTPIPAAPELCINCGHCAAVCPHGALELKAMPLADMPPLRPELKISADQAEQFLRSRRSIRLYKDQPVDQATLTRLLDLARFAPSGHNIQPVNWTVFSGKEQLKALAGGVIEWMRWMMKEQPQMAALMHMDLVIAQWEAGHDRILRGAPHVIVAHAPKSERTAPAACTIALTFLDLAASALGMGACWAGYFGVAAATFPPLQKALALPEGHLAMGAMMVGWPKMTYHRLPARNAAKVSWR
jgi:nitroreductase/NAD-dependent dihydropyrimidine dehydrogenase PreA subunit